MRMPLPVFAALAALPLGGCATLASAPSGELQASPQPPAGTICDAAEAQQFIGRKAGEVLDFGGLLGYGPIMPVNQRDPSVFINRGGRLPAPMQSLKN